MDKSKSADIERLSTVLHQAGAVHDSMDEAIIWVDTREWAKRREQLGWLSSSLREMLNEAKRLIEQIE